VSLALALGIWIGASLFSNSGNGKDFGKSVNKLREVFGILESEYVDPIDQNKILETSLNNFLNDLDPHSTYIPMDEIEYSKSSLESGFEGIGAEFSILNDTAQIISIVKGGPSDLAGILPGDRIIACDGTNFPRNISSISVFRKLRGPKGTLVELEVLRPGVEERIKISLPRARITSSSIDASFVISPHVGYLKISRFSDNTFTEALNHLKEQKLAGANSFIIDVRDNTGGYLDRATKLAGEFLPENQLILFTEGRAKKYNQKYYSSGNGHFLKEPLIILVNEGSASASEILAGAIQDNDRGLIVGRRTFGKGLVQVPISLKDGSELRLTISRYFTPSGRCIQKPYHSNELNYNYDLEHRYVNVELFQMDSIHPNTSLEYKTNKGRIVYGGGGITPDVFVPLDTNAINHFMAQIVQKNLFREFSLRYYRNNKTELETSKIGISPVSFRLKPGTFEKFVDFCEERKLKWPITKQIIGTDAYISTLLKAYISKLIWGETGYFEVLCQKDPVVQKAIQKLGEAKNLLSIKNTEKN
jgi:carboxyl-terminal processing protease